MSIQVAHGAAREHLAACDPRIDSIHSIRTAQGVDVRPSLDDLGWERIAATPDYWQDRWPGYEGAVWYRVAWTPGCEDEPAGVLLSRVSMAGAVFSNDDLLWRDERLTAPLSQSWNLPRYAALPAASLRSGQGNAVWIYVVGLDHFSPGLGHLSIGPLDEIADSHAHADLWQRELYKINLIVTVVVGVIFFAIWLYQPALSAYGWFAVMALAWTLFASNILATSPWPFGSNANALRWNHIFFVVYVAAFCSFTWHFAGQAVRRIERTMWAAVIGFALLLLAVPEDRIFDVTPWGALVASGAYVLNCLQFTWHAWRTRTKENVLLAVCLILYLGIATHDTLALIRVTDVDILLVPLSTTINLLVMSVLLAWRVAEYFRRMQRFNVELQHHVTQARQELTDTLEQQHTLAMHAARLQERLALARELHDGLGSSLVRSIATVERAPQPMAERQVLSMLKSLRDDLRQIVDSHADTKQVLPDTPAAWCAPLRHRFVQLFETLGIASVWNLAPAWPIPVNQLMLLNLARVVEEALANVIKHSQARQVQVRLWADTPTSLAMCVEDDGIGFDLALVRDGTHGVGLSSMRARIEKLGGDWHMESAPGQGTRLTVVLRAAGPAPGARPD